MLLLLHKVKCIQPSTSTETGDIWSKRKRRNILQRDKNIKQQQKKWFPVITLLALLHHCVWPEGLWSSPVKLQPSLWLQMSRPRSENYFCSHPTVHLNQTPVCSQCTAKKNKAVWVLSKHKYHFPRCCKFASHNQTFSLISPSPRALHSGETLHVESHLKRWRDRTRLWIQKGYVWDTRHSWLRAGNTCHHRCRKTAWLFGCSVTECCAPLTVHY